ncbi:MAG: hypothetical protein ACFB15_09975 [Cyclobacteriaceae bacterium]
MKPILNLIFSTLLGLSVASCATSPRESAVSDSAEEAAVMSGELEAQFTSDHLSADRLDALEVRAQQKLLDFADYVTLIGNPAIDSTFRQQAQEQARQLFMHPQTLIAFEEEKLTLDSLLNKLERAGSQRYIIQNIKVTQPLRQESARRESAQQESTEQYSGTLTFSQPANVEMPEVTYQRVAEIWVKKVDKQFGDEQKQVWEVFLGSIK